MFVRYSKVGLILFVVGVGVGVDRVSAQEAPSSVPGCSVVGAVLTADELFEIVPGQVHVSTLETGKFRQRYSLLPEIGDTGATYVDHPEFGESAARYRIDATGVCSLYDNSIDWYCEKVSRCDSGEVDYVGWVEGGAAWAIDSVEPDLNATVVTLQATRVENRLAYETAHIAPAANWSISESDIFRGFPGLTGLYLGEGAGEASVIRDFLLAHSYSTGQRFDDGRRRVSTLVRIEGEGLEVPTLFHRANEGGTRAMLFGVNAPAADRVDLASATAGVVDLLTDAEGASSREHWNTLEVHIFSTLAYWDPATHSQAGEVRVISPRGDLFSRSILVCDATEIGAGAPQVTLLGGGATCRRYDRAFELTEVFRDRNALQIAAALDEISVPMVMQVGEISIAGETIVLRAAPVSPFVLLNTGQFMGWEDWMDRTQGERRERPVTCQFPTSSAGALGDLEEGDLLRFRAALVSASDASVQLDCTLD